MRRRRGRRGRVDPAPGTGAASVASTPGQYDAAASLTDETAARARELLAVFDGPRVGLLWTAFTRSEQDALGARVQAVADRAAQSGTTSRTTAATLREQAIAQQRAQEQAAREEAERQEAEAQAQAQADAEAEALLVEARRRTAAASPDSSGSSASSRSSGSSASSGNAGGAYPGYTGPRCYAPGGRTWRPC